MRAISAVGSEEAVKGTRRTTAFRTTHLYFAKAAARRPSHVISIQTAPRRIVRARVIFIRRFVLFFCFFCFSIVDLNVHNTAYRVFSPALFRRRACSVRERIAIIAPSVSSSNILNTRKISVTKKKIRRARTDRFTVDTARKTTGGCSNCCIF